jgi:tetratricopeptide (TPR) repeat protein
MRPERPAILVGVTVLALLGVFVIRSLDAEREYRRLLADGEQAMLDDRPHAAVDAFSEALALRPGSMVGRYRRGEAFAALGRTDEALTDLTEARRLAPGSREPLEALGRLADQQGKPDEAASWYAEAASQLTVADPKLLYALALARFRSGVPAAAIEPLNRALSRDPSMAEAHYLLGLAARDAGLYDESAAAFEQAIRLSPSLVSARAELAELFYERGRVADEVVVRRALAALDPSGDHYIDLALASLRAGRHDDAFAALAQAEGFDRADSRVALALGRVHLAEAERLGDPAAAKRALVALERALGGTARRSEGLALFGRALYLSGDLPGAVRILTDAVLTSPTDREAFGFLADAAERSGQPLVARDALVKLAALEGDTVSADVRRRRSRRVGALSAAAGDWPTAHEYLTGAVKAGYVDAATLGLLARARWETGDRDGARQALGEALALDRANVELRRLARTIR